VVRWRIICPDLEQEPSKSEQGGTKQKRRGEAGKLKSHTKKLFFTRQNSNGILNGLHVHQNKNSVPMLAHMSMMQDDDNDKKRRYIY
jgi:hypothetical protein